MENNSQAQTQIQSQNKINPDSPTSIIEAMLPVEQDSKKMQYISYRASGFSVEEACQMVPCHQKSVSRWRDSDPWFNKLDTEGMSDLRDRVGNKFLMNQFNRNMQMFLQLDFNILLKAHSDPTSMTEFEQVYLGKVRNMYSAQQLAIISQIFDPKKGLDKTFDFSKLTMTIRRERDTLEIHAEE